MVALAVVSLTLGAISALPVDAASLFQAAPKPSLGPLNGTDPRILNGTCPSTDKNTTCEAPHPARLKELKCGGYDTASRQDLEREVLLRQKWLLYYGKGQEPFGSVNCPVPAQTCRRFACFRSTGLFVCNHNVNNITLSCSGEVDAVANKINEGCCTRKGTWSSDGVSGHYTTDQGWRVVIAYANCAGEPDWDAFVPNKTGAGINGVCETANDGLSDREAIPSSKWVAMTGHGWPTVTYQEGNMTTATALKPGVANLTATANSTAAPRTTAAASLSRLNTTAAAGLGRVNTTAVVNATATTASSRSGAAFRMRTGPAVVTALATSTEGGEAQVTGEVLPNDDA